jgi:hypothetical protein
MCSLTFGNPHTSFSTLDLLEDNHSAFTSMQDIVITCLRNLSSEFNHYVPDHVFKFTWVENILNVNKEVLTEDTANIPKLHDLLTKIQITVFWIKVKQDKEISGRESIKVILPLETTYRCEAEISALNCSKDEVPK